VSQSVLSSRIARWSLIEREQESCEVDNMQENYAFNTAAQRAHQRGVDRHRYLQRRIAMQRALLSLALIASASVTYAQTMPSGEPRDAQGRPCIGCNDWVRQPGDQPGPVSGSSAGMGSGRMMSPGAATPNAPARHMGGGTVPGPGTHGHSSSPIPGETKDIQQRQHDMPATPSHSSGPPKQ
jgi:hypothetical protein